MSFRPSQAVDSDGYMHDRYGGRLLLDANLVVALWGAISLFGVLVALLIPRTDQNYQTFLELGSPEAYQRARTWALVTRSVPLLAFCEVLGISLVGLLPKDVSLTWPPSTSVWVIIAGLVTQLLFTAIVIMLVKWPPSYNIPALNSDKLPGLKSHAFGSQSLIFFINKRPEPVRLSWVDYNGTEQDRGIIYPGNEDNPQGQNTSASHPFVVRDQKDNSFIALFVARSAPGRAVIPATEPGQPAVET